MPLPSGVDSVTVTGTYKKEDGTPLSGSIEFIGPRFVVHTPSKTIFSASKTVVLDANGAFSVVLMATDSSGITPTGFTYQVAQRLDNSAETIRYPISLPKANPTTDLAYLIDVTNFM